MSEELAKAYKKHGVTVNSLVNEKVELYNEVKGCEVEKMATLRNKMINEMVDNITKAPVAPLPPRGALPAPSGDSEAITPDALVENLHQIVRQLSEDDDAGEQNLALLNQIPSEIAITEDENGY